MHSNNEQQLKAIKSKILQVQLFSAPGAILLGLGLYGIFGANGNAFHPSLNSLLKNVASEARTRQK